MLEESTYWEVLFSRNNFKLQARYLFRVVFIHGYHHCSRKRGGKKVKKKQ